jgi:hypothetical protein
LRDGREISLHSGSISTYTQQVYQQNDFLGANIMTIKYHGKARTRLHKLTSAHALGRTKRPMRPASLALRTFSNNGTMVEFGLQR